WDQVTGWGSPDLLQLAQDWVPATAPTATATSVTNNTATSTAIPAVTSTTGPTGTATSLPTATPTTQPQKPLCAGYCNVIGGNTLAGVGLSDAGTAHNTVAGNYIGVDLSGTQAISNGVGILITGGAISNTIGGARASSICVAPCNVIGGNGEEGVQIS